MDSGWVSFALLVAGLALLLNPLVPGVHLGSETVYRFEAASVDYTADEGLELRSVPDGDRLVGLQVDDEILCEDRQDWWTCRLASFVQQNGTVPGYASAGASFPDQFEFVYLADRFYRPTTVDRGGETRLALDPVNDSDPLEEMATTDLPTVERQAIESGRVVTYRNVVHRNQLLRADGEYFVVYRTARKRFTRGNDRCIGTGDGFCDAADWKRRTDTALTLGSWLAGFALLFRGVERVRA